MMYDRRSGKRPGESKCGSVTDGVGFDAPLFRSEDVIGLLIPEFDVIAVS